MKTAEEFVRVNEKMNSSNITDWSKEMLIEALEVFANAKAKALLEEAAEKAQIKMLKKSQYGKNRKWQKVVEDEVDLFDYEVKYLVDKESILSLIPKEQ